MKLPNGTLFLAHQACKAPCGLSLPERTQIMPSPVRKIRSGELVGRSAPDWRPCESESRSVESAVNGDVVAVDVSRLL